MVPGRFGRSHHGDGVVEGGHHDERRTPASAWWVATTTSSVDAVVERPVAWWNGAEVGVVAAIAGVAQALAVRQVGSAPHAGHRRQVVGGDAGQRLAGEGRRGTLLEPQQPVGEDAAFEEVGADLVLHRAEVLADDEGAGAVRLEGQEVEQVAGG